MALLDLSWTETEGRGRLSLEEADRAAFDGQSELQLAFEASSANSSVEPIDLDSRFGSWLLERLGTTGPVVNVRPSNGPSAVNDVASRLFAAYRVDGGQIHLGGCQLTDLPFLRLSFAGNDSGGACVYHVLVAHDGSSVPESLVNDLGLLEVELVETLPPRIDEASLNSLVASGRRIAAKSCSSRDPAATTVEPLMLALVWVKHASGKLQFTVGDSTVELPFSGWAKLIEPPPYVSEHSGASSFHLAATDDGRIDAADQIVSCEYSHQKVLSDELVTCCVTGKRVLQEFTELCPVAGVAALKEHFGTCAVCRQKVCQAVLTDGICTGCSELSRIKKDDPRLVWILGEHPGLDRWSRWQLSETGEVYIAQAASLTKRLLVVVDKESLAVRHLATAGRISSTWTPLSEAESTELLG